MCSRRGAQMTPQARCTFEPVACCFHQLFMFLALSFFSEDTVPTLVVCISPLLDAWFHPAHLYLPSSVLNLKYLPPATPIPFSYTPLMS